MIKRKHFVQSHLKTPCTVLANVKINITLTEKKKTLLTRIQPVTGFNLITKLKFITKCS